MSRGGLRSLALCLFAYGNHPNSFFSFNSALPCATNNRICSCSVYQRCVFYHLLVRLSKAKKIKNSRIFHCPPDAQEPTAAAQSAPHLAFLHGSSRPQTPENPLFQPVPSRYRRSSFLMRFASAAILPSSAQNSLLWFFILVCTSSCSST